MAPLSIAIAGIGNVGQEVIAQLLKSNEYSKKFVIGGVSYKNKKKKRNIDLSNFNFYKNPVDLAFDESIHLVIELIGGEDGVAKELSLACVKNKKPFITANKALIAKHGNKLSQLAKENKVFFGFEAAVAGCVPVIKVIKESLISNKIQQITGILNGTCNYLLDEIEKKSLEFDIALKEAQKLGYAESDPTFDIEGIDAAHKIIILSSLVFGEIPNLKNLYVKGISNITLDDINFANSLNYKIKLLATSYKDNKNFQCSVEPWLIPNTHPLSKIEGVLNSVQITSDLCGSIILTGAGAGSKPTASSILSDLYDYCANKNRYGLLNKLPINKEKNKIATMPYKNILKFYLRTTVLDKSGVLADLTSIFKQYKISIQSFFQELKSLENEADLIIITHETDRKTMESAINKIKKLKGVIKDPINLSIYD